MCLTISILLSLAISVSAQPRLSDTDSVSLSLTFVSGDAICSGSVIGGTGTTSITNCTVTLKDSSGTVVDSWSNLSSNSKTLPFSKTSKGVTKGVKYTLSVSATVNRNGKAEPVSNSVSATY